MRLVAFDVDDTLYLERDYVTSGFRAVGAHLGRPDVGEACTRLFAEGVRGDTFDRALAGCGLARSPALVAELVAVYREHRPAIDLLPDAAACLDALVGTVYLGVVTDGPAASQRAKVAALGVDRLVGRVIVTAELGPGLGKPHPRAFELLEQSSGATGGGCAYVGDNPAKDFVAPHARGWRTVRVRRPGGLHRDAPSGADVDHEIESLDALASVL